MPSPWTAGRRGAVPASWMAQNPCQMVPAAAKRSLRWTTCPLRAPPGAISARPKEPSVGNEALNPGVKSLRGPRRVHAGSSPSHSNEDGSPSQDTFSSHAVYFIIITQRDPGLHESVDDAAARTCRRVGQTVGTSDSGPRDRGHAGTGRRALVYLWRPSLNERRMRFVNNMEVKPQIL